MKKLKVSPNERDSALRKLSNKSALPAPVNFTQWNSASRKPRNAVAGARAPVTPQREMRENSIFKKRYSQTTAPKACVSCVRTVSKPCVPRPPQFAEEACDPAFAEKHATRLCQNCVKTLSVSIIEVSFWAKSRCPKLL